MATKKFDTYSFTVLVLAIASVVFGALALCGCGGSPAAPLPIVQAPQAPHKPTCAVDMSAPRAVQGANFFGTGTLTDCTETDWDGVMQVRVNAGGLIISVDVDRRQTITGNTYDVEDGAVSVWTLGEGYGGACRSGAVTWVTDEPDWHLDVDAFCLTEDGLTQYFVAGSFYGHVYDGNN